MNRKSFFIAVLLLCSLLTACAPMAAATPAMIAAATAAPAYMAPAAPEAPAATANGQYPYAPAAPAPTAKAWYPGPTPAPTVPYWPERKEGAGPLVNPPVNTKVDHLSTFALDVDTASYTMARQSLFNGQMPSADSIRPEEFVNFFRQDYQLPANAGFAIYADGAPSPFHSDGTYFLRVGIQGYDVPDELRKPLSLTFVIDTSGSMSEANKLEMVKDSLRMLVDHLRPVDSVSIVAYSETAWVVLPTVRGSDRNTILNAIYSMQPSSTTNVEAGLRLGYQMASSAFQNGSSNRVILCTDGVANEGDTDPGGILEYVHGYTDQGITLTAIGVGMGEYNDSLLEQLADKGDGNYYYVDAPEEAHRVFVEKLTSTLQVIALNAKVQVDFNTDVVAQYRLIGYEDRAIADQNFRNDSVDAGEIGAGHSATAIYAVQFRPNAAGRIATVQLRWEDPTDHNVREINGNLNTWDVSARFEDASPRYRLSVLAAEFAEFLRQSPYAGPTNYSLLDRQVSCMMESLREDKDVSEFEKMVSAAEGINHW